MAPREHDSVMFVVAQYDDTVAEKKRKRSLMIVGVDEKVNFPAQEHATVDNITTRWMHLGCANCRRYTNQRFQFGCIDQR
ncbi:unnamed protein product [Toxocara canis]|uniref:MSP domain-containing protein n=1 Tax=Toxocara canis TaxID=6265 RepID=A0A183V1C6_TOXCA|nr:unnamed protein product [Toxocara canis]